jgi:bifunctional DNase/RNase
MEAFDDGSGPLGHEEERASKRESQAGLDGKPLEVHDLLKNTIAQLGATLRRVVINKLEFNTFFAKLQLETRDGGLKEVDARPSDGIAIALRADAPIFVAEEVLTQVASSYGL